MRPNVPDLSPTFDEYYRCFAEQMRRRGCTTFTRLVNGATIAHIGSHGPCLAVIAGLHGDERSGPLAILEWVEGHDGPLIPPDRQMWLLPLLNDEGWDANRREWCGLDLNRSFLSPQTSPALVWPIMDDWQARPPDLFVDLHEDELGRPYLFRYPDDEHDMTEQLAAHLDAGLVDWTDFEVWEGSDEVLVRRLGCSRATTIEATVDWPLGERVGWYVKALHWCAGYLGRFENGSAAGAQPGTGAPHPRP